MDQTALHLWHILEKNMKMMADKQVIENSSEIALTLLLQCCVY
jgi:hypothetical protein